MSTKKIEVMLFYTASVLAEMQKHKIDHSRYNSTDKQRCHDDLAVLLKQAESVIGQCDVVAPAPKRFARKYKMRGEK